MPSDLTAAIEAAKRIVKKGDDSRGKPSKLQGGYVNTAIQYGYKVAGNFLDLTSQPLYRRRKAEWRMDTLTAIYGGPETWTWTHLYSSDSIEKLPNENYWIVGCDGEYATLELAQAACESHFWRELERDVVEKVN